ncbi:carboxypeptidase regulatory-like domain-containing protein [Pyxidicoccus parkwayensis]|uniref:Carboxypeptidase regulatory-like domain-containing protein n=1 Tax=Pyxidicoccus parkwayensis TaxID=2813578 RepID=A0ABX7NVW4_9BACT|nr:carboxypeptidase regulatory-like domain-containing protein [Pyxidicoccus parkwaysis]QSQ22551.1 carboxypeptidase regulatory-like domain-containing protein [Pyxidicoccus parkwaysis]
MTPHPSRLWTCVLLGLCACIAFLPVQAFAAGPSPHEQCRTNLQACFDLDERPASEKEAGCKRGDDTDCFLFGLSVIWGSGVPKDEARGFQLLGRACQQKHFSACEQLLTLNAMGEGGAQEAAAARPMLEKSCSGGEPMGCFLLGEIHSWMGSPPHDEPRARTFYEQACERGVVRGCSRLGSSLVGDEELSKGVSKKDLARAKALLTRGCTGGDGEGCSRLGSLALAEKNPPAACEAFKKGCDADSASACDSYGTWCDEGFGRAHTTLVNLERSCREGRGEDCEEAGLSHERGEGTRKAPERAAKLYQRGCELGSFVSCERLASLEGSGYAGSPAQPEKARQRLFDTCERKLPHACVSVGEALREGRPWLPKDLKAASGYSLRACEQGDADGCEALALAYEAGSGVEQSGERALEHHRKACGLGRAESCIGAGRSAEALKKREEAVRAYQQGCFRGTAAGCEALTRLGEATSLVERSQQVELFAPNRATEMTDLLLLPDSQQLLATAQEQLQLVDLIQGQPVGAPVDLSSQAISWKTPAGSSELVRRPYKLSLSWDARAKEPFGFFEDATGHVMLWRPGRPNPPPPAPAGNDRRCLPLAYHSSGRRVLMTLTSTGVCGDSSVLQQFDVETDKPVGPRVKLEAPVTLLTSSADGSRYAVGLKGGAVRLIDATTGKVTALPGWHTNGVDSLSFHPTRPLLATASFDEGVALWDLSGSTSAPVTIRESVRQVRFSPDGKLLAAAGGPEGLLLLDASTGLRASSPMKLSGGMSQPLIVFSSDGRRLAVADAGYQVLLVTLRGAGTSASAASVPSWFTKTRPLEPPVTPKPPPILKDGRLEGSVKFEGRPVPDAEVVLTPGQEWDDALALGTKRYPVKPDGTFVLTNVPRIEWQLTVEAPGKKKWGSIINGREKALHTGLNATLERAGTLRGRVLSPDLKPAAGVQVSWREPYSQKVSTVVTDASGRFVIDHLSQFGTHYLKALGPNGDLRNQTVELDKLEPRDVELVLRRHSDPAVLRIRVLTAGGKPAPGAELILGGGVNGVTDEQGRWSTDEVGNSRTPFSPRVHWRGNIYDGKLVSVPYPEEVVITVPDAKP